MTLDYLRTPKLLLSYTDDVWNLEQSLTLFSVFQGNRTLADSDENIAEYLYF